MVARANTIAELRGWTPFSAIQVEYSLIERTVERELVPMADALGLGVLAWGPLGGGLLTGKYTDGEAAGRLEPGDRRLTERNHAIADAIRAVAGRLGATPAQVALAWLRSRGEAVIPIVGARSEAQLGDSLGYLDISLDAAVLGRLEEASAIEPGFPGEMLARFGVGSLRPAALRA